MLNILILLILLSELFVKKHSAAIIEIISWEIWFFVTLNTDIQKIDQTI